MHYLWSMKFVCCVNEEFCFEFSLKLNGFLSRFGLFLVDILFKFYACTFFSEYLESIHLTLKKRIPWEIQVNFVEKKLQQHN